MEYQVNGKVMSTSQQPPIDPRNLKPRCPACKRPVAGLNIAGIMIMPTPGSENPPLSFMMPCCPYPDCSVIITAQLVPDQDAQAAGAPAPEPPSLWTPR